MKRNAETEDSRKSVKEEQGGRGFMHKTRSRGAHFSSQPRREPRVAQKPGWCQTLAQTELERPREEVAQFCAHGLAHDREGDRPHRHQPYNEAFVVALSLVQVKPTRREPLAAERELECDAAERPSVHVRDIVRRVPRLSARRARHSSERTT